MLWILHSKLAAFFVLFSIFLDENHMYLLRNEIDALYDALAVAASCHSNQLRRDDQLSRMCVKVARLLLKVAYSVRSIFK